MPWNFGLLGGAASSIASITGGEVFSDSTYYYRVFKSNGTLSVSGGNVTADVLVVAGGGGGGRTCAGGGGGGGFLTSNSLLLTGGTNYSVTVGAGGAGGTSSSARAASGANSTFSSVTSTGGGGGGGLTISGASGGSGGGGGSDYSGGSGTPGQGNNGAAGPGGQVGGGGGGASTAGSGKDGGSGSLSTITGSYYSGGGGGGTNSGAGGNALVAGMGGVGGGSRGFNQASLGVPLPASINSGGGGGGSGGNGDTSNGGNGGSGIVVIRYPKNVVVPSSSGWETDLLSQHLKIALPLNASLGTADHSASIRGTGSNRVATPVNAPLISTTQSKFYGTSLNNVAEGDDRYISIPNSSDLTLGTSDFCVEGWWYFTNNNLGYQVLASHSGDSADGQNGWVLITETNNTLYFYATDAAGGWDVTMGGAQIPTANAWHHVAVTRSGNVFRLFYNGTQVNTQTVSVNIALPNSREFRLGSYRYIPGYPQSFNGFMQDFRMYIGTPKYTSNFTPPGAMYLGA